MKIAIALKEVVQAGDRTPSRGLTPLQAARMAGPADPVVQWRREVDIFEKVEAQIARWRNLRKSIVDKHEAKDEGGKTLPLDERHPNLAVINDELGALLDAEIEIDIEQIPIDEIAQGQLYGDELRGGKFMFCAAKGGGAASPRKARAK